MMTVTDSDSDCSQFPGFQVLIPKDEYVPRKTLNSRLQRRAPRPLQLKQSVSFKSDAMALAMAAPKAMAFLRDHLSSSASLSPSSSLANPLHQNKDPIPLLSPLVPPPTFAQNSAKSL